MDDYKNSEAWRLECEARELLKWSLKDRRKQIALIWEKRGGESAIKLQDEITRLWKLQKNQQQKPENSFTQKGQSMEKQKQIDLI
jgi:hypothetical protein